MFLAEEINVRVKHKGMTLAEWNKSTVILMERELGVATDTGEVRVGNGKDKWASLPIIKGEKGDQGIQGIQGKQGVQGARGATGQTGARGEKGDSITVSSTTRDSQGNTIVNFSDGSSVTIPKGEKGDRGATGARGATGEVGPKGDKGDPLKFEDLTQEQINQIKAQDVDLTNYATKDDLAKVDVSSQLKDYATKKELNTLNNVVNNIDLLIPPLYTEIDKKSPKDHTHEIADVNGLEEELDGKAPKDHKHDEYIRVVGVNARGQLAYTRNGKEWKLQTIGTTYGNELALKDHTHDEYIKKGDPIELTPEQKAELKGSDGLTTFIRYANNPSGDNMTASPQSDTTHIGIFASEGRVAPPTPSVYQWTRIKGEPGKQGNPGTPGRDGTSVTTWVGTQSQYDRIYSKSSTTLYLVKG